jgi:hypothetical protein
MANGSYSWLTLAQGIAQLSQRLNDPNNIFWTQAELQIYISQSLRQYNVMTNCWRQNFNFNSSSLWNSLGSLTGSPRLRTITDSYCYTELEYLLLEPPSGSTWTGTKQFNIGNLSQALQSRRDEMLEASNCNQSLMTGIALTPNTITTLLPGTIIDVERVRYLPVITSKTGSAGSGVKVINVSSTSGIAVGQVVSGTGINYWSTVTGIGVGTINVSLPTTGAVSGQINFSTPTTLYRDDTVANEWYEAPLYQQNSGIPQTFSLSSEPPLSWIVDIPPAQPGTYEAVVLQPGTPFNPPASTLLGIPDDFCFVAQWGALADLLGRESEATDRERADYAKKRYQDGLLLMLKTPWIELGKVNGVAVSIDSIVSSDRYSSEWDSNPTGFGPVIIAGGMDNIAAPVSSNIGVTVLASAPILDSTNTYLQISQSDWDSILDLSQSRCLFKIAGGEWKAGLELEARAIQAFSAEHSRIASMGAFSDILQQRGGQQERDMNRYNTANKK